MAEEQKYQSDRTGANIDELLDWADVHRNTPHVTQEEFDELDAVVNGGSSETAATTTWKEGGTMINAYTGAEFSISSQYYAASDLIQIPNGIESVRLLALVIKPGGSFNAQCGLAFYDASQTYISGILREEYDHGGSSVAGMAERTYNVPSGARYMRTTCMTSQEGNWFCYFISSTGSGLVGRMNDAELNIDAASELAQEAYDLAEDAGQIKPSHDVYRHATDPDAPTNLNAAQRGRAVYTTVFTEDKKFNQFIVKSVKASAANTSVLWRMNLYANTNTNYDYIPARADGLRGTTIKTGSVTVGDTAADVVVSLGEDITCPAGSQVIIYMMAQNEATIQMGRPATVQDDTHGGVHNTSGEWTGTWYNSYPTSSVGYGSCAPVLRYESAIMSREEVEDLVDDKLAEAGIDNTPTHVVYQHASDPESPALKSIARMGVAVYTGSFAETEKFNAAIVKSVSASADDTQIEWRVYVNPTTGRDYDDIPLNGYAALGTMVASGTTTIGTKQQNFTLRFDAATCPSGNQIIVYLLNTSTSATLTVGAPTDIVSDTHGSVGTSGTDWSASWTVGYPTNGYRMCAPLIMWQSNQMSRDEVIGIVEEEIASSSIGVDKLKITLGDEIYCFVGSEVNIYNHYVSLPVVNGRSKQLNYIVEWKAASGSVSARRTEQGIRIRPTAAGTAQIKCTLLDTHDNLLDEKTITVHAVAKDALTSTKNFLFVGASWTQSFNAAVYDILSGTDTYNDAEGNTLVRYTGTCPNFLGTQQQLPPNGPHCEGRGGWTWKHYADEDEPVDDPGGVIDFTNDHPFLNPSTGKLAIAYYRSQLGMGNEHFDFVAFMLGLNDVTRALRTEPATVDEYKERLRTSSLYYLDMLVRAFVADNPNAQIVINHPTVIDNRWVGYDENLSTTINHWERQKSAYAIAQLMTEWVTAYNAELGETHVYICNSSKCLDPHYSMQLGLVPVNDRWAKDKKGGRELVGRNVVHPSPVGYAQCADELAAEIVGRLGTLNTTNANIGYAPDGFYGQADEEVVNGKGLKFDVYLTTTVSPVIGTLAEAAPWYIYDSRNNRFLARSKSTYSYHTTFSAQNLYMTDGHPKPDIVYWLGDVPYMYNGTTLVKMSEMGGGSSSSVDQTARDAAAAAQTRADSAYTLANTANTTANAALPASTIWSGTQTQYDALTAEQKAAIIAFIEEEE